MKVTPIAERVGHYLMTHPYATRLLIHPDDVTLKPSKELNFKKMNALAKAFAPLPLKVLGKDIVWGGPHAGQ
jgi:hypothetical protein